MSNKQNVDSEGRFWRVPEWFPTLSQETLSALRAFHSELIFFNGRMNLISPKTERAADSTHFADGILGSQAIFNSTKISEIYDIGSGNGIPGIIFSILFPGTKVILVDADARKVEFMKHCISRLRLTRCSALHSRLEDLPPEKISHAMCRGFSSVSKVLISARSRIAPGGMYFHFKGPAWSSELAAIPSQVLAYWEPSHICDYKLPAEEIEMSIILTRRT